MRSCVLALVMPVFQCVAVMLWKGRCTCWLWLCGSWQGKAHWQLA